MQITLNGQPYDLKAPASLLSLAERLGLDIAQVAIEHNGQIVPRSRYGETMLTEGDRVEIVQFIGGG